VDRALIAVRYGTWLRRIGSPKAAREVLADAAATAEASGTVILTTRAKEELAATWGRKGSSSRSAALSPQERRVAEAALAGSSTKEIAAALGLSARTVESHLASLYRKLNIRSRRELLVGRREFALRIAGDDARPQ
jgi:DNA-binding NarL/FixJ family response regulator